MKAPFKMKPGRGNMPKTGKDIPLNMKSPMYMDGPGDKDKKSKEKAKYEPAKVGEIPGIEEIKKNFPGYSVTAKPGKLNEYSLRDSAGSVSYKPGPKVESKKMDIADIINASINKKNK
jgi:hypothetical protein